MSRFIAVVAVIAFCFSLGFAADAAAPAAKNFGKVITLKEATPIAQINADPTKFANKEVLITGKVVDVCQESGCWVQLEADSARILCQDKSHKVLFPKNCAGSMVTVQGKVVYNAKAAGSEKMVCKGDKEGKEAMKAKEAEAMHACPTSKVMVKIEGASLVQLAVAPEAPKTDAAPAVKEAPKAEKTEAVKEVKTEVKKEEKKVDGKK